MNLASPEITFKFAQAINALRQGRKERMRGDIADAYIQEIRGEKMLGSALSAVGMTRLVDLLMTAWEGSLAEDPLELPEFQALIYSPEMQDHWAGHLSE